MNKFKINLNINVSLMTVRDFWRLIYLLARLERNNERTIPVTADYTDFGRVRENSRNTEMRISRNFTRNFFFK